MNPGEPAARVWLGLDPASTLAATRSALLHRLGTETFWLDPLGHEAELVLAGRPARATPLLADLGTSEGRALRDQVEAFAAAFFQFPVPARRETWFALRQASKTDSRLQDRLRRLKPGLLIDPAAISDRNPLVNRLATDLLELFVLEPGAHAALARQKVWALQQDLVISLQVRNRASRHLTRHHRELNPPGTGIPGAARPELAIDPARRLAILVRPERLEPRRA